MNKTMQAMQERFTVQLFPARCYKKYRDIESGETLNEFELLMEYREADNDDGATFREWLNNCMTRNNGTLEELED